MPRLRPGIVVHLVPAVHAGARSGEPGQRRPEQGQRAGEGDTGEGVSILVDDWAGCYKRGWGQEIVPEAYAHPAKLSFSLGERIYRHLVEEGWAAPGMTVLDPFGGIGGTAYHAALHGLTWVGVELEPRFVALAQANIDLWRKRYGALIPGYGR